MAETLARLDDGSQFHSLHCHVAQVFQSLAAHMAASGGEREGTVIVDLAVLAFSWYWAFGFLASTSASGVNLECRNKVLECLGFLVELFLGPSDWVMFFLVRILSSLSSSCFVLGTVKRRWDTSGSCGPDEPNADHIFTPLC